MGYETEIAEIATHSFFKFLFLVFFSERLTYVTFTSRYSSMSHTVLFSRIYFDPPNSQFNVFIDPASFSGHPTSFSTRHGFTWSVCLWSVTNRCRRLPRRGSVDFSPLLHCPVSEAMSPVLYSRWWLCSPVLVECVWGMCVSCHLAVGLCSRVTVVS